AAPGSTAPSAAPASTEAPDGAVAPSPIGPGGQGRTPEGLAVGYETSEVSPGYFEGTFTVTNPTGRPVEAWTLSFRVRGAVIANVWGGTLTRTGSDVVIVSDGATAPIAPGGSVTVRFGGSGTPVMPEGCTFNGGACGF
ncbi:cellulose binding domain-containing protein, partial [Actinocorallia lasiicapitis]